MKPMPIPFRVLSVVKLRNYTGEPLKHREVTRSFYDSSL